MGKSGKEFKERIRRNRENGGTFKDDLEIYAKANGFNVQAKDKTPEDKNGRKGGNKSYNKKDGAGKKYQKGNGRKYQPKELIPPAKILMERLKANIINYLNLAEGERESARETLFNVGDEENAYPILFSDEDCAGFAIYPLERTVRSKTGKLSITLVVIDQYTGLPTNLVVAYITPKMDANIKVYPQGETGPDYKNIVWWDSRAAAASEADTNTKQEVNEVREEQPVEEVADTDAVEETESTES